MPPCPTGRGGIRGSVSLQHTEKVATHRCRIPVGPNLHGVLRGGRLAASGRGPCRNRAVTRVLRPGRRAARARALAGPVVCRRAPRERLGGPRAGRLDVPRPPLGGAPQTPPPRGG